MSVEMKMSEIDELMMEMDEDKSIDAEIEEELVIHDGGTTDYNKLKNIPTFNGKPMVGDVVEIDPTVPDWAKKSTKPDYNPEEIGAINADSSIPLSDLALLFD